MNNRYSLKRKIWIAIALVTFLPLLILLYIFTWKNLNIFLILILSVIVFSGWLIIFEVFFRVMKIHSRSQYLIKQFSQEEELWSSCGDETETLEATFQLLSAQVRKSIEELEAVTSKTEALNRDLSYKVKVLSTIFQAHSLFSKGLEVQKIITLLLERLKEILEIELTCVVFTEGKEREVLISSDKDSSAQKLLNEDFLGELSRVKKRKIVREEPQSLKIPFLEEVGVPFFLLIEPIHLQDNLLGFLILLSTKQNCIFSSEELEVVELFSKNIGILWEHRRLSKKVEDLEMFDSSGLMYNEKFFRQRLEEEIKRAITYQRPCGLLILKLEDKKLMEKKVFSKFTEAIKRNLRPLDILGRLDEEIVGVILIEKNRRQCLEVGKRLQEEVLGKFGESGKERAITFVVAEMPLNGSDADSLITYANLQLKSRSHSEEL